MIRVNIKNEKIKRKFLNWLEQAEGLHKSTIDNIEKAILLYEDFTKQADFVTFKPDKAIEFKKWLKRREFRGKVISITTYHAYLRDLRKFFIWLTGQAGYKSKITPDIVGYLKISGKEEREATQYIPRKYPPLEYVIKLTDSIKINSEIDQRDRALISFTLLSGMRDKAIATLPIGCFDEDNFIIYQNPRLGVETKFSKYIFSVLFRFDDRLVNYVIEWTKHLKAKGFGSQDPLFPRSKLEQGKNNLCFESASEVEPVFWQGAGRIRETFKKRFKAAGLQYYPPHTFRHLAVDLAVEHCKGGEQIKAISQNFGHEYIGTTFSQYANYDSKRLTEILKNMDFSEKPSKTQEDKLEEIKKILLD